MLQLENICTFTTDAPSLDVGLHRFAVADTHSGFAAHLALAGNIVDTGNIARESLGSLVLADSRLLANTHVETWPVVVAAAADVGNGKLRRPPCTDLMR